MPARTVTRHHSSFTRTGAEAVTYDLSTPDVVTITVPPFSKWTSGPHWHEVHTEYLQILQGRSLVTMGTSTWIHTPTDGIIEVKSGVVHEWRRVPGSEGVDDLVVKEWTNPADGEKEVFFRMLNSFLTEPEPEKLHSSLSIPLLKWWLEQYVVPLQLFIIFAAFDNWPVILGKQSTVIRLVTHAVLGLANVCGQFVFGLQPQYDEYVSEELQNRISTTSVASNKEDQ